MSVQQSAYSTLLATLVASTITDLDRRLRNIADEDVEAIVEHVIRFLRDPVSPMS